MKTKTPITTFVFPGLDGTGLLLDTFKEAAPPSHRVTVLRLPDDPTDDYDSLCDHFSDTISGVDRCVLIGESFSGPLVVLLARRFPEIVIQVVLVASFVKSPTPLIASAIPWNWVFRMPLPAWLARMFLLGQSDDGLVAKLQHTIGQTSPQTLARRVRLVMGVNVTAELRQLKCPVIYVRPHQDRMISANDVLAILNQGDHVFVKNIDGPHLVLSTHPIEAWNLITE